MLGPWRSPGDIWEALTKPEPVHGSGSKDQASSFKPEVPSAKREGPSSKPKLQAQKFFESQSN